MGVPRALAARTVLGWAPAARRRIVAGVGYPGARTLAAVERDGRAAGAGAVLRRRSDDAVAAVVFTSGSTGPPKGVEVRHPQLAAQARALGDLYDLGPGTVNVATFPPFALFGPLLGMTTVIPRMDPTRPADADPEQIAEAVRAFGATVLFGSPALLRTLGRWARSTGALLPTLRTVLSAGAPVPLPVIRDVLRLCPDGARVATPYGATEALPVTSITSAELLALDAPGTCVGRPVAGVDVTVVRITDGLLPRLQPADHLPPGEVGEVVVRGPVVTGGYVRRPEATALATTEWDGHRAHRMGDLGVMDADGRLWFCGRRVHRVETPDGPLHTVPTEARYTGHPAVARAALVGIGRRPGQRAVLVVELEPGAVLDDALRAELLAFGDVPQVTAVLDHPVFPVDVRHNAKVGYELLAAWAAKKMEVVGGA